MDSDQERDKHSLTRHIQLARRQRTIMFSDIVHSTRFWATHGDVQGRLMLDRHNWLLFPIIKKFKGHIIKTIGDAIMASFKHPNQALHASIAMQQILDQERRRNPNFKLAIRIGLHTGHTIVEQRDVYGDTVNVASRIESQGKRHEILLSPETNALLSEDFPIRFKKSFRAKGIAEALDIYSCQWQDFPDLVHNLRLPTRLPLIPQQRIEMVIYSLGGLAAAWLMAMLYLRYIFSDHEAVALILFNPPLLVTDYPWLLLPIGAVIAGAMLAFRRYKFSTISLPMMHVIKGLFGFCLFFALAYLALSLFPKSMAPYLYESTYESKHLFVQSVSDEARIYEQPALSAPIIKPFHTGQILLLADIRRTDQLTWNKVLIRREVYGWVPRVLPPQIGVPEKRLSMTNKFYFRHLDIIALLAGLIGLIWGMVTFRVRPA